MVTERLGAADSRFSTQAIGDRDCRCHQLRARRSRCRAEHGLHGPTRMATERLGGPRIRDSGLRDRGFGIAAAASFARADHAVARNTDYTDLHGWSRKKPGGSHRSPAASSQADATNLAAGFRDSRGSSSACRVARRPHTTKRRDTHARVQWRRGGIRAAARCGQAAAPARRSLGGRRGSPENRAAGVPIGGGAVSPPLYGPAGPTRDSSPAFGKPEPEPPSSGTRRRPDFPAVGRGAVDLMPARRPTTAQSARECS